MSQLEVLKFIEDSAASKKVNLMFKINEEKGHIPSELFYLLRQTKGGNPEQQVDSFDTAIEALGFESPQTFYEYVKPTLE